MKDILHFGGLKMRFLKVAETFCSRLHGCRWAYIWHFGGLKMRFLAGCETHDSRVHGVWWEIFLHFDGTKMKFLPICKSLGVTVHVFMRKTFYQFGILKMRSVRVLRISAHGYGGLTYAPEFSLRKPVWVQTPDSHPTKLGNNPK